MAAVAVAWIVAPPPADARETIGPPPPFIVTGAYHQPRWQHRSHHAHWRRVVWRHYYCRGWNCRW
jgi:hypothetical protein